MAVALSGLASRYVAQYSAVSRSRAAGDVIRSMAAMLSAGSGGETASDCRLRDTGSFRGARALRTHRWPRPGCGGGGARRVSAQTVADVDGAGPADPGRHPDGHARRREGVAHRVV